ncbi:MAG: WG repeat-containing protein, partial [Duncaniella sp.]|nr:WG repeat-containing protein [Duncaniella sp.]
ENGLEGVKWCWGGEMIPAEYDKVEYLTRAGVPVEAIYVIVRRAGKSYLLDHKGSVLLDAETIEPVNGVINQVTFSRDGKWGLAVDSRIVLDPVYDEILPGSNGFFFMSQDGKHGFIDPWGKVLAPRFDSIDIDEDDYITVSINGQQGYVDEEGNFTPDLAEAYYNLNMNI